MAVRVNTLGKSAILNRQLNSSYDVVEYVADNMPLLLDLVKKFDTLKIVRDIYDIINHVANQEIHLTEEQVNSLNQIGTISAALEQAGINVSGLTNQLTTLSNSLQQHINNNVIHVTNEDKTLWNSYADTLQALTDLINQVNNKDIDYNDLKNKPVLQHITIDSALDSTSRNPLENRAIANELSNYPTRSNISRVGFTGQYRDLVGVPSGDTVLDSTSTNWVTNKCVTEAIEDLADNLETRAYTKTETDTLLLGKSNVDHTHSYNDLTNKPTIPTKTSDLTNDSGFITSNDLPDITVPTKTSDLQNDSDFVTLNDLDIPTKTSDLTNDSGFITGVTWNDVSNKPTLAAVSTSGSYNDLTDKPTIPDVSNYYTKAEVDALISNAGVSPSTNALFIGEPYSLVNSAETNLGNYEEVSND